MKYTPVTGFVNPIKSSVSVLLQGYLECLKSGKSVAALLQQKMVIVLTIT